MELLEECHRDSKNKFESAMVNEQSGFEFLRLDSICFLELSRLEGKWQ